MARQLVSACLIREGPAYRRVAFVSGLKRLGYHILDTPTFTPHRTDVLVTWNRHNHANEIAKRYEAAGAAVIVAENGYVGKDKEGRRSYALARSHHNGAGKWFVGVEDRWASLGIELRPWRTDGKFVLALPQRGVGPSGVAMPSSWPREIVRRLKKLTDRPVRVRMHPGLLNTPLQPDLRDCWAAVTWGSGAGIKALIAGVPVCHDLPNWIGADAASFGLENIETPFVGDRMPMLQRLAWAQFTVDEIATGEPFARLLAL